MQSSRVGTTAACKQAQPSGSEQQVFSRDGFADTYTQFVTQRSGFCRYVVKPRQKAESSQSPDAWTSIAPSRSTRSVRPMQRVGGQRLHERSPWTVVCPSWRRDSNAVFCGLEWRPPQVMCY